MSTKTLFPGRRALLTTLLILAAHGTGADAAPPPTILFDAPFVVDSPISCEALPAGQQAASGPQAVWQCHFPTAAWESGIARYRQAADQARTERDQARDEVTALRESLAQAQTQQQALQQQLVQREGERQQAQAQVEQLQQQLAALQSEHQQSLAQQQALQQQLAQREGERQQAQAQVEQLE